MIADRHHGGPGRQHFARSADFTSTTPSIGAKITVSASCVCEIPACACDRSISRLARDQLLLRAASAPAGSPPPSSSAACARATCARRRRDLLLARTCQHQRLPSPAPASASPSRFRTRCGTDRYCCGRNIVVLDTASARVPNPRRANSSCAVRVATAASRLLNFLRPAPVLQFVELRLRLDRAPLAAPRCRSPASLSEIRSTVDQLRLVATARRSPAAAVARASGAAVDRIQPRDHLPLLHPVAFVHRALHQAPGGLEGDVDSVSSMLPETRMRLPWAG